MAMNQGFVYKQYDGINEYLVRGTKDMYAVSLSGAGHTCRKRDTDECCMGNVLGKRPKFGVIAGRNTDDAQQWCKHIYAALMRHRRQR